LAPASSLLFLPFHFKCFLFGIFFFSSRKKERKTQRKKNHREKKMKRKNGASLSSLVFLASAFGMKRSSCFLPNSGDGVSRK
jgi:hypothetical protein